MIRAVFSRITGFMALAALLFAAGIMLASRLPVMMYPQTERPRIRVSISHPGVSAITFQNNYAEEFEPGLLGLENLETIESSYASDESSFTLTFDWNIDRDDAIKDVESLLASLNSGLPEEIKDSYRIRSYQGENAGFLVMGITSEETSPEQIFSMLSRSVEPKLEKIDDVEEIGFFNVEDLSVDILLRQSAMLPYGIKISDVNLALREGILPFPLGSIEENSRSYSVRFNRGAQGIRNIERIVVKKIGDRSITLGEIADISIEYVLPANLFLVDGTPVVQLNATPVEGGNVSQMTEDIMTVMEAARSDGLIPADSQFRLFLDPAKYIQRAISNVVRAALIGGALAVFIVFLILGELRNTLIIAFSLPFTVVLSFILMYIFGVSLNLISLGGLALAVGMIVDSTIVVMENIHRLRVDHGVPESRLAWREIVSAATDQVRAPVIASVLTSVLVFFPISFTAPLTNAILGNQALTVIFSLICSLFVALFLVPLVAYALYRPGSKRLVEDRPGHERLKGLARLSVPAMMKITAAYKKSLGFILRRKALTLLLIAGAFGILALSVVFLLPTVPKEIISPPSSDRVVIFFRNFVDYPDSEAVMDKALPDIGARIKKRLG